MLLLNYNAKNKRVQFINFTNFRNNNLKTSFIPQEQIYIKLKHIVIAVLS